MSSENTINERDLRKWEACRERVEKEISLVWTRGAYFWAFSAAVLVVYATSKDSIVLQLIISPFGFVLSFLWWLAMRASRKWQKVWEEHLIEAEKNVTGKLYGAPEKYNDKDTFVFVRAGDFSPSRLSIIISILFSFIWVAIFVSTSFNYLGIDMKIDSESDKTIIILLIFMITVMICAVTWRLVRHEDKSK